MQAPKIVTDDCERQSRHSPLQREVLRDVMLSAAACDTWLSLEELARMTSYPPASISAQLRHLRKEQHGGYRIEKRCRSLAKFMAGVDQRGANGPVWEYRLDRRSAAIRSTSPLVAEAGEVSARAISI
jgi:biotin operon repressor